MAKRLVTISEKNHAKLADEENASKLVDQLLTWYYSGAYDVVDLEKQRKKVAETLQRITEINRNQVVSFNRLASAVEDLTAAREHQGDAG